MAYFDRIFEGDGRDGDVIVHARCDVGYECTVYAMTSVAGHAKYWLRDVRRPDVETDCITFFPAACFEIVDPRVSAHWEIRHDYIDVGPRRALTEPRVPRMIWAIRDWFEDPRFLENVVDGRRDAVTTMRHAMRLMDAEYGPYRAVEAVH